jgi:SAM-dependent methyltransferase
MTDLEIAGATLVRDAEGRGAWERSGLSLTRRDDGASEYIFHSTESAEPEVLHRDEVLHREYCLGLAGRPDVPWQTSPLDEAFVRAIVRLAAIRPHDLVVDVGCGDGQLLLKIVAAAGCCGLGLDISEALVRQARARARADGLGTRVHFAVEDILREGWRLPSATTVLYLFFLLPRAATSQRMGEAICDGLRDDLRVVTFQLHPDPCWRLKPSREDLLGVLRLYVGEHFAGARGS